MTVQERIQENLRTQNTELRLIGEKLNKQAIHDLAKCTHLKSLTLWSIGITDFSFLQSLTELTSLHLRHNQITDFSFLQSLKGLTSLNLSHNQITDISVLQSLKGLASLYLSYNQITDISVLQSLKGLTGLYLHDNQITDFSFLQSLTGLTELYLSKNQITDISFLQSLTGLTELDLSDNQITDISYLADLPALQYLFLYNNPVEYVPKECLGKDDWDDCFRKVKPYLENMKDTEYVFEGKLVLVGEPSAGKTSLCEKLQNPAYELKHTEPMTRGISVSPWTFPYTNPKQTPTHEGFQGKFTAHIFDFGGQDIMHATHRYFFSHRTVYVLVVDTRPEDTDFFYWLNVIALFGENSPVAIVMNDKHNVHKEVPSLVLEQFAHLVGNRIFHVNLRDNKGLADLVARLQHELQSLPHVGEERHPKAWIAIRKALDNKWLMGKKEKRTPYLPKDDFLKLCTTKKLFNQEKALSIAQTLHTLGSVLYFHNNLYLQNFVILDKHWATEAVYLVLLDSVVAQNMGKFEYKDLQRIWKGKYKPDTHGALVELMLNFKIAYRVKNTEHTYIAPQLLQENPPSSLPTVLPTQASYTHFEYQYTKFMPKGLLSRLIIEKNRQIHQDLQWRTGVVLEVGECLVEAVEHRYGSTNKLAFRVLGKEAGKALAVIYEVFAEIHGEFPNLQYESMIPCNCTECRQDKKPYFFQYKVLQKALEKSREAQCQKSLDSVPVAPLLEGFEKYQPKNDIFEMINRLEVGELFSDYADKIAEHDQPAFEELRQTYIAGKHSWDFYQRMKAFMLPYR